MGRITEGLGSKTKPDEVSQYLFFLTWDLPFFPSTWVMPSNIEGEVCDLIFITLFP